VTSLPIQHHAACRQKDVPVSLVFPCMFYEMRTHSSATGCTGLVLAFTIDRNYIDLTVLERVRLVPGIVFSGRFNNVMGGDINRDKGSQDKNKKTL
jgi:hypothetical protein